LGGYNRIFPNVYVTALASWKMIGGRRFLVAGIVLCTFLVLSSSTTAQSTASGTDDSTIFPSLAGRGKQNAAVWLETNVRQKSPVQKTVFQQADHETVVIGSPTEAIGTAELSPGDSGEFCPECGRALDHPILGACDGCGGPGWRLLQCLRPGRLCGGLLGLSADREPWIDRPFSAGLFVGPIVGSPLMDDWVGQQTGTLAGLRLGWDMDDDWGVEMRFASANIPVYDSQQAIAAQQNEDPQYLFVGTRNADHFLWDIDVLYYPWGDAALRPYLLFGLGTARIKFMDRLETHYARILAGMPVGLGVKTRLNDWLVFRVECTDNIAFAGGSIFQTQHNASLTGALEVRLGRSKTTYWPWNPGK
jgi:hypothetical protein